MGCILSFGGTPHSNVWLTDAVGIGVDPGELDIIVTADADLDAPTCNSCRLSMSHDEFLGLHVPRQSV